jgi:hypothetical protein
MITSKKIGWAGQVARMEKSNTKLPNSASVSEDLISVQYKNTTLNSAHCLTYI